MLPPNSQSKQKSSCWSKTSSSPLVSASHSGKCGDIMMQLTVAIRLLVVNTISRNLHQPSSY